MPKIPALPPMTSVDTLDELPIEDVSAGTTKYITLTKLKEWFQTLTSWVFSENLKCTVAFYGYKTGTQATSNGTAKVTLNNELYDEGNDFDPVTNSRFVAPVNGYYWIAGGIRISNAASARCVAAIYKNGAGYSAGICTGADTFAGGGVAGLVKLAANDYVELYHTSNTAGNNFDVTAPAQQLNFLCGALVGGY